MAYAHPSLMFSIKIPVDMDCECRARLSLDRATKTPQIAVHRTYRITRNPTPTPSSHGDDDTLLSTLQNGLLAVITAK